MVSRGSHVGRVGLVALAIAACGDRGGEHLVQVDAVVGAAPGGLGGARRPSETEGRQEPNASPADVGAFDDEMRRGDAAIYSGRF